ncbi:DUF5959 family protein [Streptomyces sp. NPDC127068]|uniref:DUF5959 family protein n=1 Tax=Streptomyces sp. NPDC127068 TaxID=3347127 RepID=UPI00364787BA
MTGPAPADLIHLAGADGNRCVVRVTGCDRPGGLTGHDILHVNVLVAMDSVDALLGLRPLPYDLGNGERRLTALGPGGPAALGGDGALSLDDLHAPLRRPLRTSVDTCRSGPPLPAL